MSAVDGAAPDPIGDDREKARALARMKRVATAALLLCALVFVVARRHEDVYPALGYVAAFAEAAVIGGIADWYAVVALFRRPLGLPFPHTAIIPANRDRIADNLGQFFEKSFLTPEAVRARVGRIDFARYVSAWMREPRNAEDLARFLARMAPQAFAALERSPIRAMVGEQVVARLREIEIAPVAAQLLQAVTQERRHQRLFDGLLQMLRVWLADEKLHEALRAGIRAELPTLAKVFRADAYLLKRLVDTAGRLIEEAAADPDHPLRHEFDRFAERFVDDLKTDPAYIARAERIKADLLARPELGLLAGRAWSEIARFLASDVERDDSVMRVHLAAAFEGIGARLETDEAIRRDMNAGFAVAIASMVEDHRAEIAAFISDQVKAWDVTQASRLIELNIGRDLQYIRFNGMIIGGLAGLALHALMTALG